MKTIMSRVPVFLILSIGFLFLLLDASISTAVEKSVHKEVIVIYKNEEGKNKISEISEEIEFEFTHIPGVVASFEELELEELRNDRNIAYVEENSLFMIAGALQKGVTHGASTIPWNLHAVNATQAWNNGFTGKKIKVAVIDSGIAPHEKLSVAGGVSTIEGVSSWIDDNGHGTHVAGTIAAKHQGGGVSGVAPDVELYAIKALDRDGVGSLRNILAAIDWSIANKMDIINLSLGTDTYSQALEHILNVAYQQGILIVGASGNTGNHSGTGNTVNYPAKFESVIAVAAVDSNMNRAPFSSTGHEVEFSAPGISILSTHLNNGYQTGDGTSFAAPHITGLLAVLKERNPHSI